MKKNIPIIEAISSGLIVPGDAIEYHPQYDTFIAVPHETGFAEHQRFVTEKLCWIYFGLDSNSDILLVSRYTTFLELGLFNTTGYNNGLNILNEICEKLYSNDRISAKAKSISAETWNMIAICDKITLNEYWIASQVVYDLPRRKNKFYAIAISGNYESMFYTTMLYGKKHCGISKYALKPIVTIPKETLIMQDDTGSFSIIEK